MYFKIKLTTKCCELEKVHLIANITMEKNAMLKFDFGGHLMVCLYVTFFSP